MEIKQSKKKQALLNMAQKLFMEHGIRRITVEEVCKTADASKMTFYRFFKNKDEIARAVIDGIADRMMGRMETVMEQEMSFGEKMKAMMQIKEETMNHFSRSFLADLLDDESLAGQHLLKRRAESLNWVKKKFLEEQAQGKIRGDVNISFVLMMAEYFRVFMKDARFQSLFESPSELGKAVNDFYLYGIIGPVKPQENRTP